MTRRTATVGREALLERESELKKTRELRASGAASDTEVALRCAGMFDPGGALLFAHPIAPRKRSREPRAARPLLDDLRPAGFAASTAIQCARLDLLTGDLSTAEEELRRAWDASTSIGENYLLPPLAALLAEVVSAQGRLDEAEEFGRVAALASSDDSALRALWPSLRVEVREWRERAHVADCRAREALHLIRIAAALSRLTAAYSRNPSTDSDRSASDRRAWNAGRHGAHPITEKLDEAAEHIVEVLLNAIEAEKLSIDNDGGVHIAPSHGVCLHAAIAAIEQGYGRPPQAPCVELIGDACAPSGFATPSETLVAGSPARERLTLQSSDCG